MNLSMKLLVASCLVTIIGIGTLQAQRGQNRTPEQMAEKQTERLTEKLGLTTAQASEVQAVNLEYAEKLQALREEYKEDREAGRIAGTALKEEQTAEIKMFLTDDQINIYDQYLAEKPTGKKRKKGQRREGEK